MEVMDPPAAPPAYTPALPKVIDPLLVRDLQIALLQRQILQQSQDRLNQQLKELLIRAGVDPNGNYQLNLQESTITPA